MNFLQRLNPVWALRLTLGIMYLYSGFDLVSNPKAWTWALPYWLRNIIGNVMPPETFLRIHGTAEIVLAFVLLAWFMRAKFVRWVALISTAEFFAILVLAFLPWSETNFLITFRDIGLLGASASLYALLSKENDIRNNV